MYKDHPSSSASKNVFQNKFSNIVTMNRDNKTTIINLLQNIQDAQHDIAGHNNIATQTNNRSISYINKKRQLTFTAYSLPLALFL